MTTKNALTPVQRLKNTLNAESVQEQFKNALRDSAPLFVASVIDIYSSDKSLQECEPGAVIAEALKAATLKLPINRNLGFAHLIAFKVKGKPTPQMIIGYKGLIQMAMRTSEYRYLNADVVYEGELRGFDKLTGQIYLDGEKTSDEIVGYFAYLELLNGFSKGVYWTKKQVEDHGKKYSRAFSSSFSPWQTDFDSMALKTVLRNLISKWGIMSVEMLGAVDKDIEAENAGRFEEAVQNANSEDFDIIEADFADVPIEEVTEGPTEAEGPGF